MKKNSDIKPHALFRRLWHRHGTRVFYMCLWAARGNVERARDLVQYVAIHLLQECDRLSLGDIPVSEWRWVTMATRRAIDRSLRGRSVTILPLDDTADKAAPDEGDLREIVDDLAQGLDSMSRTLLDMRLQGYSNAEIAAATGLSTDAVDSRMHRMLQAMRRQAAALGYIDTDKQ